MTSKEFETRAQQLQSAIGPPDRRRYHTQGSPAHRHLRHPDHSKGLWALLGRAMPDYEPRREALRRMGPRLGW